jgi:hypothetical protein
MKFYIGYDAREHDAALVAQRTLAKVSGCDSEFVEADKLSAQGMLTRITDHRGRDYDLISNAPKSTTFAVSRFLVPLLCQSTWGFFSDCDMVFYEDPRRMLAEIEGDKAVYVVKHQYEPSTKWKMQGLAQTKYSRKNWSSVMLFNCQHPANKRLSLRDINERPGRDLHQFYWLHDDEIGELHPRWNWLVGEQPKPPEIGIAHFTLGGPWFDRWQPAEHDELWLEAARLTQVRK